MLRDPGTRQLAASDRWQEALGHFATVGLAEVADTASSDRTDTKFVLGAPELLDALEGLGRHYRSLDIDGTRFTAYRTMYFDTESFALYRRHHAGGGNRYKVRTRTYMNTGLCFIEIKRKTGRGGTQKLRQQTARFETQLAADSGIFVDRHCSLPAASLGPSLLNRFNRVCLVGIDGSERLTIDLDLAIETAGEPIRLPGIAVAELKQERVDGGHRNSAFLQAMRCRGVRPTGFSKYCMGILLTRPEIKHNLFKPQLRDLRRLMGEPNVAC